MIATDVKTRFISSFPGIHEPTESLRLRASIEMYIADWEKISFRPITEQHEQCRRGIVQQVHQVYPYDDPQYSTRK